MKKILIFYNFKGAAELDWILPLIYRLKQKYEVFTIFKNSKALNSLKSDKKNFKIWRKISKGFFVEEKTHYLIIKIFIFFIKFFHINSFFLHLLRKKIYNIKNLNEIISKNSNLKSFKVSLFFSEFGFSSGWVDYLKVNKNIKCIHFPSTPQIYLNKIKKKFYLGGDILFLNSYLDKKSFSKHISKEKLFVTGNPKYDPWWLNKIYEKANMKNNIVIAYNSKFDYAEKEYSKNLKKQLIELIKILNNLNKKIVFKIHPTKNSPYYKVLLKKYAKFKWIESKKNLIELTQNSTCLITHPYSAAGMDAIMNRIPVLQLWPIIHYEFNQKTSFEKLKLVIRTSSVKNFNDKIKLILKNKKIYLKNNKISKYYPPKKNTIARIISKLEDIQKK